MIKIVANQHCVGVIKWLSTVGANMQNRCSKNHVLDHLDPHPNLIFRSNHFLFNFGFQQLNIFEKFLVSLFNIFWVIENKVLIMFFLLISSYTFSYKPWEKTLGFNNIKLDSLHKLLCFKKPEKSYQINFYCYESEWYVGQTHKCGGCDYFYGSFTCWFDKKLEHVF